MGELSDFRPRPAPYELRSQRVIFLVNTGTELLAFDNHTPRNSGCWVAWIPDIRIFHDPCLGTKFSREGSYLNGPPSPPLGRYDVRLEGSQAWIDLSKLFGTTPAS